MSFLDTLFGPALNALGLGSSPLPAGVGQPNPYMSSWDALIAQLRDQAAGKGPSVAQDAYRQAFDQNMASMSALGHSGNAQAAGQMGNAMGANAAGLQQGLSEARTREELGAQQELGGALQGAGQAWLAPQQLALQAWQLQQQQKMQQLQAFAGLLGGGASLFGGGGMGGMGAAVAMQNPGFGQGYGAGFGGYGGPVTSPSNSYGGPAGGMFGPYERPGD